MSASNRCLMRHQVPLLTSACQCTYIYSIITDITAPCIVVTNLALYTGGCWGARRCLMGQGHTPRCHYHIQQGSSQQLLCPSWPVSASWSQAPPHHTCTAQTHPYLTHTSLRCLSKWRGVSCCCLLYMTSSVSGPQFYCLLLFSIFLHFPAPPPPLY